MTRLPHALKFSLAMLLAGLSAVLAAEDETAASLADLQRYAQPEYWTERYRAPQLSRETLVKSIEGARAYYLNNQFTEGNFLYAQDVEDGKFLKGDNQTRQAGALWGLTCLLRDRPTDHTRRAVLLDLDFFLKNRIPLKTGEQNIITYPGEKVIKTGTVALFCLSLTEFLACQGQFLPPEAKEKYQLALDEHLLFLKNMELPDGGWSREYEIQLGLRSADSLSYYDGEALLAYCRAARCLGREELLPRLQEAMPKLFLRYTTGAWAPGGDAESCKGFYQWGCLAAAEYLEAGWPGDRDLMLNAVKALSWWTLYDNWTAYRGGNTAYAVEGLIASWRVCQFCGDREAAALLKQQALEILGRLTVLQIGGPFQERNAFLKTLTKIPPKAHGGIVAARESGVIRIDIVQHQLHAMLLALKYFFAE